MVSLTIKIENGSNPSYYIIMVPITNNSGNCSKIEQKFRKHVLF